MIKLYVILLSHPALAARLMLQHKGLPFQTKVLLAGFHPMQLRLKGFSGPTVPAMQLADGRKVQGTLKISRALEELEPKNPLFPGDAAFRKKVEDAERWGEAELQSLPRRLFRWALVSKPELRVKLAQLNKMPVPGLTAKLLKPMAAHFAKLAGADDARIQADLQQLPLLLDHADALVAEGVIGGAQLNAADYQIGTTMRILLAFDDLRPTVEKRPSAALGPRLVPEYGITAPPVFPAAWLRPLR